MNSSLYTSEECEKIATAASLRYVRDSTPGIQRRKQGRGFVYYDTIGERITDKTTLKRIKALAIPPAYQNVWICAYANGHIQATGIDDKQRKQYIYHSLWNEVRQQQKFASLLEFGYCLPTIRHHIRQQLKKTLQLRKEQVICAIIYLLDTACIRIGNSLYAKENQSYGLTTLRKKHLLLTKNKAVLSFRGKNAHPWSVILKEPHLIKLLKQCEEIPGYELFKYYDSSGTLNVVTSQDVNGYLQALTNHSFTAKTFRTWIACREVFYRLAKEKPRPDTLQKILNKVALLLGHTPAICRKSYIDPELIHCWETGDVTKWVNDKKMSFRNKEKLFIAWLKYRENFSSRI